jgi:putative hydrolase of the HAD superfamily
MAGIQAIVFDYGGVIMDMRWDVARRLEAAHALPAGAVPQTLYTSDLWRQVEIGAGDREEWLRDAHITLEQRAGKPLPPLHDQWRESQGLIDGTIALIKRLRPPYRTSILSNADNTLSDRLRNGWRIHDLFDDIVCSADVGLAKPDPRIYALAASRLGLPPEACVFIDDMERNTEAARAAGMHAIHYRIDLNHDLASMLATLGIMAA